MLERPFISARNCRRAAPQAGAAVSAGPHSPVQPLVCKATFTTSLNGKFEPRGDSRVVAGKRASKVFDVKNWIRAGVAFAALAVLPAPVLAAAAASPELPAPGTSYGAPADVAVSSFYAQRGGAPLWLRGGAQTNAA